MWSVTAFLIVEHLVCNGQYYSIIASNYKLSTLQSTQYSRYEGGTDHMLQIIWYFELTYLKLTRFYCSINKC